MRHRIRIEPPLKDLRSAFRAPAVFTLIHPAQRRLYPRAFEAAAAQGFFRHLLALHQIHSRQPADRLLIERDRGAFVFAGGFEIFQFLETRLKRRSRFSDVMHKKI